MQLVNIINYMRYAVFRMVNNCIITTTIVPGVTEPTRIHIVNIGILQLQIYVETTS